MNFLLVAVNASFSHTNLAVRVITEYVKSKKVAGNPGDSSFDNHISFVEFTINQPVGEILRGISAAKPDVVMFSSYIWNGEILAKIIPDVKKVAPGAIVGAGGPEFGFAAELYLNKLPSLDFIIKGEGEVTVCDLIQKQLNFPEVPGVYYRNSISSIKERSLICDLSEVPFPYPEITEPDHKMYYYESSRGCPFKCSYCMSSLDVRVRFMPLERVYADLQRFLDAKVRIVKFVDRTYNLQPDRYIAIWQYILDHHNGKTMFHFEIEAEYLTEEAIAFLQKVPAGVMQFEIGVQSSNKKTLKAINRSENIEKLAENIKRIPRTIHQHLDLIAGLPYENLESFGKSFDFVAALRPDALQLGFLKVLHGTQMEAYAKANGWQWMENPVYETFSTPYMSYEDMMFLKDLEIMVDAYMNSGKFQHLMNYVHRNESPWQFFCNLVAFGKTQGTFDAARREAYWFDLFYKYLEENKLTDSVLYELLKYDYLCKGKNSSFPVWLKRNYNKDRHLELMKEAGKTADYSKQDKPGYAVTFNLSEYDVFTFDVDSPEPENNASNFEKLIIYTRS